MLDSRGQISITGAVVAGAITVATLMAAASLAKFTAKAQRTVQSRNETTELGISLRMILQNPALCAKAFWDSETKGNAPDPHVAYFDPDTELPIEKRLFTIRFADSNLVSLNAYLDPTSKVTLLGLGEVDSTLRTSDATTTTYLAKLVIAITRDEKANTPGTATLSFPLYVQTDKTSHQIIACSQDKVSASPSPTPGTNTSGLQTRLVWADYQFRFYNGTAANHTSINYGADATCNADEMVVGGGIAMGATYYGGFNEYPVPEQNAYHCDAAITGCSGGRSIPCGSRCYATCLKLLNH